MSAIVTQYVCSGREKKGDILLLAEVDGIAHVVGPATTRVILGSGKATLQLKFNRKHSLGTRYRISIEEIPPPYAPKPA